MSVHIEKVFDMTGDRGFTLVELLIVIAIIGIISAIAIPAYQGNVQATNRADCQSTMLAAANALERYKTGAGQGSYSNASLGSANTDVFPGTCPMDAAAGEATYNLSLPAADLDNNTFTLLATPTGSMAGTGRMTLNHAGRRCWFEDQDSSGGTCTPF